MQTCVQGTKVRLGEVGNNEVSWKSFQEKAWQHNRENFWMRDRLGGKQVQGRWNSPALSPWDNCSRPLAPGTSWGGDLNGAPWSHRASGARCSLHRQDTLQASKLCTSLWTIASPPENYLNAQASEKSVFECPRENPLCWFLRGSEHLKRKKLTHHRITVCISMDLFKGTFPRISTQSDVWHRVRCSLANPLLA